MSAVETRPGEAPSLAWTPLRSPLRWVVAGAATVSSIAHIPVIAPHLAAAPYMGEELIVVTVACGLVAVAVVVCDSVAAYALGILTCGLALAGYAATRLVAFPQLANDVGNWIEPLGVVAVIAEAVVVGAATWALASWSRRGRPVPVP